MVSNARVHGTTYRIPWEMLDEERTRLAHLPFQRTREQFDFAFQPSIDERLVRELANLAFVPEASNIRLLRRKGPATTTPTDGIAGHQRCGSVPTRYKWLISNPSLTFPNHPVLLSCQPSS